MDLHLDIATKHLNKFKEELCGDSVEIARSDDSLIVVLSDGLGSGVKANILSSLTTKMAATMLQGGLPLNEVINTLASTLPVCEVRRLAYSTFSILQVFNDGTAYLVEYDSPESYIGHGCKLRYVHREKKEVSGRIIKEAFFSIKKGDWIVLLSDGLLHAGIGGVWNLGWGAERVGKFLESITETEDDACSVADEFIRVSNKLYASKPGDDGTCVIVKVREKRVLSMLVGPPVNKEDDAEVVQKLFSAGGKKVVCGGTTANIVVRILGKTLSVDLQSMDEKIPPIAKVEGIDLVTEGMLTLSYVVELLKKGVRKKEVALRRDGASRLTHELLWADNIHIVVGRAMNPAHQSPDLPVNFALKQKIVDELLVFLRKKGKVVSAEYY